MTIEIDASELPDGGMIARQAGEDSVLIVRRGDEYFALDAFCTHYHAPLADGAITGETIRCPWHHACFDLRSGAAVAAPAMRPLRTYGVTREGDRIRVDPSPREPVKPGMAATPAGHIAIIGAGAAGSFAASELRRLGFGGRVTLLTAEERLPYDKPNLSKDYLAGRAPAEWIPLRQEDDYRAAGIDLRLRTRVEEIDTRAGQLRLDDGERLPFDRLILATGASPRRLDVPTDPDVRVHYLRTWADAETLSGAAAHARRAVVIGASFIGLETAASLRERGLDVTVIGAEERPLERVLGAEIGAFIRRLHEQKGVRFRLGQHPVELRAGAVVLADGSSEPCDLIVIGAGVVPELALAERAGLAIDRGVVVDELLQTSAANIFAAGDIARFPWRGRPIRVEHWVAAGRQGQTAARNAMGASERFAAVPFFWSQHYDLVFAYVGHAERTDDVQLFGSLADHNAAAVYRQDGRVAAVVTLFRDDVSLAVEAAMEQSASDDAILDLVRSAFQAQPPLSS